MLELRAIHNKGEILKYLESRVLGNFMYHSCNVDKEFWEYTQFYGLYEEKVIKAIGMISLKYGEPILIAASYVREDPYQSILLEKIRPFLPQNFYGHINRGDAIYLAPEEQAYSITPFYNMLYTGKDIVSELDDTICILDESHLEELEIFYRESHPDYMIEEAYVKQRYYYGIRRDNKLVCVVGIFSLAQELKVIQLGNIATHPQYRNQGLTQKLIRVIIGDERLRGMNIVLNVKQNNKVAVHTYQKVGFEIIGEFDEVFVL